MARAAGCRLRSFLPPVTNYYPKSYGPFAGARRTDAAAFRRLDSRLSRLFLARFSADLSYEGLPTVEEHRGLSGDALIQAVLALL